MYAKVNESMQHFLFAFQCNWMTMQVRNYKIGHSWIVLSLPIKARLGAQSFIWKLFWFACEWKLIFTWKAVYQTLFSWIRNWPIALLSTFNCMVMQMRKCKGLEDTAARRLRMCSLRSFPVSSLCCSFSFGVLSNCLGTELVGMALKSSKRRKIHPRVFKKT